MSDNLDKTAILIAEYNHASQDYFNVNESRVQVSTIFIANMGTVLAALFIPGNSFRENAHIFGAIFLVLSILGFVSILHLIKIRQAWIGDIIAMAKIKEYFIKNSKDATLKKAFKWDASRAPDPAKLWSISYLMAFTLILLNSIAFTVAIYSLSIYLEMNLEFFIFILVFIGLFILQNLVWVNLLKR